MKKCLLVAFILAATLTVSGCEVLQKDAYDYMSDVKTTKLQDESTNGMKLGDSSEKVQEELGEAKKNEQTDSITHLTYGNDGLMIMLIENKVVEYQINSSYYETVKGIKVGSNKKEVIEQYGQNFYTNKESNTSESIGYFDKESNKHIEFSLKNGQVIYIKVVDIS
ncbi:hypothetical protein KDJ21_008170 [Metabacillus litoralis]|uniref:hypothetical protein n=1 Tax=Metabacillus TaxID=2675233 RepID=UPI001B94E69F|nr:hypothetical protein [Metabacillus litoralis]UHA61614.1 hypothetical protein KDJ21_008170 [Metabacillus litoralis]